MKCSIAVAYPEAPKAAPFLFRGDWHDTVRQALDSGYDAVELHIRRPGEVDARALKDFARGLGMEFSAVATGMSYTMDGLCMIDRTETGRDAAVERLKEYVDLAAVLECCIIIGSIRGCLPEEKDDAKVCRDNFEKGLGKVLDYAQQMKVDVCIEAINRYENNYFNRAEEVMELIRRMGKDGLKIHLDAFHMNIEEQSFEDAFRSAGAKLGYVHLADNNRHYLGNGMLEFGLLADCMKQSGYDGFLSLECLPVPDAKTAADRSIQVMRKLCG